MSKRDNKDKPINFDLKTDYSNKDYQMKDMQRYFVEGGDVGFSPERNKYIVESTLQNNFNILKARAKQYNDKLTERVYATSDYLEYLNKGKAGNAERYFGKRELARLKGVEFAHMYKNITRFEKTPKIEIIKK